LKPPITTPASNPPVTTPASNPPITTPASKPPVTTPASKPKAVDTADTAGVADTADTADKEPHKLEVGHWKGGSWYDEAILKIEDSNMANVGSDIDKARRKEVADGEPAWSGVGMAPGLWVWRVEKFEIKEWPKERWGYFFAGDSYIVLHTAEHEEEGKLDRRIHFWLGKSTTIDEQGTAAIKTVELDDHLDGEPIQYREVMNHESSEFLELWPHVPVIEEGGIETGFTSVKPEEYQPRLFHVSDDHKGGSGRAKKVVQVPLEGSSLNNSDAFILDNGLTIYQWHGTNCGVFEKQHAKTAAVAFDDERCGKAKVIVLDAHDGEDDENDDAFWALLGGKVEAVPDPVPEAHLNAEVPTVLWKFTDGKGELEIREMARGEGVVKHDMFHEADAFFLWSSIEEIFFAWIGKAASDRERREALLLAEKCLRLEGLDPATPIQKVQQGHENAAFKRAVA